MPTSAPLSVLETRLQALRAELARRNLSGFVVPISDEYLSEYVGAYAERLAWLTGFGGSAGTAVVLQDKAAIFVDGRYTLQVRDQVDGALWQYKSVPQDSIAAWIKDNAAHGSAIGYDAWLHTPGWVDSVRRVLAPRGLSFEAVDGNPVDAVWDDQPAPSTAPAFAQSDALAGRSSADKRAALALTLREQGLDCAIISALDSVAWLLNIRGADVARTPVALSYVVAHADGSADWYIAPEKVPADLAAALGADIRLHDRAAFADALRALSGKRVAADPQRTVAAIFELLEAADARVQRLTDPTVLPKAIKTEAEIAGHRAAQSRDGAAMARFLHWLSVEASKGHVTEISAENQLETLRKGTGCLVDLSFDTISGAGPNGAIVHYRVSEETNRTLEPGSVYLVDSGGQYADGTTDITRTVWVGPGEAPAEVKDRNTRVLKGHIRIATAAFPQGTTGSQLDSLARQFLWDAGLDYAHGTGHGVGAFLSVHEGPQRIAKARGGQAGSDQELMAGMIISNEPGYYKTGAYGIRIENLVLVEPRNIAGGEGDWLGFETLTLVPIDRALVATEQLTPTEIAWWNSYHQRVWEVLSPQLDGEVLDWLKQACAPL